MDVDDNAPSTEDEENQTFIETIDDVLGNHHVQLGTTVILAILTFFPCIVGTSNLEDSILRQTLSSTEFRESSAATIALTLTYLLDFIIDFISEKVSRTAYRRYTRHKDVVIDSENLVFIVGVLIGACVVLLPPKTPKLALFFTCANQ